MMGADSSQLTRPKSPTQEHDEDRAGSPIRNDSEDDHIQPSVKATESKMNSAGKSEKGKKRKKKKRRLEEMPPSSMGEIQQIIAASTLEEFPADEGISQRGSVARVEALEGMGPTDLDATQSQDEPQSPALRIEQSSLSQKEASSLDIRDEILREPQAEASVKSVNGRLSTSKMSLNALAAASPSPAPRVKKSRKKATKISETSKLREEPVQHPEGENVDNFDAMEPMDTSTKEVPTRNSQNQEVVEVQHPDSEIYSPTVSQLPPYLERESVITNTLKSPESGHSDVFHDSQQEPYTEVLTEPSHAAESRVKLSKKPRKSRLKLAKETGDDLVAYVKPKVGAEGQIEDYRDSPGPSEIRPEEDISTKQKKKKRRKIQSESHAEMPDEGITTNRVFVAAHHNGETRADSDALVEQHKQGLVAQALNGNAPGSEREEHEDVHVNSFVPNSYQEDEAVQAPSPVSGRYPQHDVETSDNDQDLPTVNSITSLPSQTANKSMAQEEDRVKHAVPKSSEKATKTKVKASKSTRIVDSTATMPTPTSTAAWKAVNSSIDNESPQVPEIGIYRHGVPQLEASSQKRKRRMPLDEESSPKKKQKSSADPRSAQEDPEVALRRKKRKSSTLQKTKNSPASAKLAISTRTGSPKASGPYSSHEYDVITLELLKYREANDMTEAEQNRLIAGSATECTEMWQALREALPTRDGTSLMKFCRRKFHNYTGRGKFTEEDDRQIRELQEMKPNQWKEIAQLVNRHPEDIRDRWRNYLICGDNQKMDYWTEEESGRLRQCVSECLQIVREEKQEFLAKNPNAAWNNNGEDIDYVNWQIVSSKMNHTRSRLQCIAKWKTMQAQEAGLDNGKYDALELSNSSWRVKAGKKTYQTMPRQDKIALLHAIHSSGASREGKIPWAKLVLDDKFKNKYKVMERKVAWHKLRRTVQHHETMDLRSIVQKVLHTQLELEQGMDVDKPEGSDVEEQTPIIVKDLRNPQSRRKARRKEPEPTFLSEERVSNSEPEDEHGGPANNEEEPTLPAISVQEKASPARQVPSSSNEKSRRGKLSSRMKTTIENSDIDEEGDHDMLNGSNKRARSGYKENVRVNKKRNQKRGLGSPIAFAEEQNENEINSGARNYEMGTTDNVAEVEQSPDDDGEDIPARQPVRTGRAASMEL